MNQKQKKSVMLTVLIISVLLLSTSTALAGNPLKIDTVPSGADVYLFGGENSGQYLGQTPIYFDTNSNGGNNLLRFVYTGYKDGYSRVTMYTSRWTCIYIYLNLTPEPTPVPTPEPTPVPTPEPTPVPTPEPTPIPTPEPTPEPTPVPTPVPTPEPTPVPTPEPNNGKLLINSEPMGADVYVKYGQDAGKYLGTTPLYYNPALNGGVTYMKFVKQGYKVGNSVVYNYMVPPTYFQIYVYLNHI